MTDPQQAVDAWKGHALGGPSALWCVKDNAGPGPDEDPQAWFAAHLQAKGCPDYVVEFERHWREDITDDRGAVSLDAVARELFDYARMADEVSKTYDELTNGQLSKPNTAAVYIVERAGEIAAEDFAQRLCETIEREGTLHRDELIALAEEWSEGAWARHVGYAERAQRAAEMAAEAND